MFALLGLNTVGAAQTCPDTPLQFLPLRTENFISLGALGSPFPPSHIFPTPHIGFELVNPETPGEIEAPLYAPGDITIDTIAIVQYEIFGGRRNYVSHSLLNTVCDGLRMYFLGLRTLTHPALAQILREQPCRLTPAGLGRSMCAMDVHIRIEAGAQLATAGDRIAGAQGFDWGARDYRLPTGRSALAGADYWCAANGAVNIDDRCYAVCPLDYLAPQERAKAINLSGEFTRTLYRTEEPKCGTIYLDAAGAAQGYWFAPGASAAADAPNLFLGPSGITGAVLTLSMGNSVPGLNSRNYLFRPLREGRINRPFREIRTSDVYCYESFYKDYRDAAQQSNSLTAYTILVALPPDARTVAVERSAASRRGAGSWQLSPRAVTFNRYRSPQPSVGSVVNAASLAPGPLAPGGLFALFGSKLDPENVRALSNNIPASLPYVSATQITGIVPYGATAGNITPFVLETGGSRLPTMLLSIAPVAPGLFTADASGKGQGAILNDDLTLNAATNPAFRGSIVVLYATGTGPLSSLLPGARIGGLMAEVVDARSEAGVVRISVRVPESVAPGDAVPVEIQIANVTSQRGVMMAIQQ